MLTEKNIKISNLEIPECKSNKEVSKGSNTNIIVLTNKCNFNCSYCFEQKKIRSEDEFIISEEKIKEIIDRIYKENPENSCIVLFGGEPLIAWDRIEFLMNYTLLYKPIFFIMNTNGYRFKDDIFFTRYINNYFVKNKRLIPEISFDGIGNNYRVTKSNLNTTNTLIDVLLKFRNNHIPFRIAYTIHEGNERNFVLDIKNIVKTFRPERVIVNRAFNSIKNIDFVNIEIEKLKEIKGTPICPIQCPECNICTKLTEKYKYYNINNNNIFVKNSTDITESPL